MKHAYKVEAREFGRGKPSTESFKTLVDAAKYIKDRWQGPEYMDGPDGFHTDYCTYDLVGFTLKDIGTISYGEWGREFTFNPTN